jgi:hypothetical protein
MMVSIEFPPGYTLAMTQQEIAEKWPNLLLGTNFCYSSYKKRGYNCVAYALGVENKDWDMLVFAKMFGLNKNDLDHSANGYAIIFREKFGFEICQESEKEEGFKKIALYENNEGDFKHLSLQLENGKWTSKMGVYEDINHRDLNSISGDFYGHPVMFMKKTI